MGCERKNIKIIQLLLNRKPDLLKARDNFGSTPLFTAIQYEHEEIVVQLIISGADLEARNNHQETPLHCAISPFLGKGNTKIVQLLLEREVDIEAINEEGNTPIYEAVCKNNYENVKLLHRAGANLNTTSKKGETLLHEAASEMHKLWDLILEAREKEDQKGILKFLIENKANIAARDEDGNIPLHFAGHANCHIVKLLIDAGSDLEAKNSSGETPPNLKKCKCEQEDCLVNLGDVDSDSSDSNA